MDARFQSELAITALVIASRIKSASKRNSAACLFTHGQVILIASRRLKKKKKQKMKQEDESEKRERKKKEKNSDSKMGYITSRNLSVFCSSRVYSDERIPAMRCAIFSSRKSQQSRFF